MVEHDLAKVGVEGSNPFSRSNLFRHAISLNMNEKVGRAPFAFERRQDHTADPRDISTNDRHRTHHRRV